MEVSVWQSKNLRKVSKIDVAVVLSTLILHNTGSSGLYHVHVQESTKAVIVPMKHHYTKVLPSLLYTLLFHVS